jgi:pyruvate-formate lyase
LSQTDKPQSKRRRKQNFMNNIQHFFNKKSLKKVTRTYDDLLTKFCHKPPKFHIEILVELFWLIKKDFG